MQQGYNIFEGATRLQVVKPSPIRAILEEAMVMKRKGLPVIALSAGEPDFNSPTDIKEETAKALLVENETHYASNRGVAELQEAVSQSILDTTGTTYNPATEILITSSGAEALNNTILALVSEGDEVIIPTPAFVSYKTLSEMCGGTFVDVPMRPENNFEIDLAELEAAITDKTKLLVLNNPCNPTGLVFSQETLAGICALAVKYNFLILSDEMYGRLTYEGKQFHSVAEFPGMKERAIIVAGFSKTYAMTGWRLGYIAADARIVTLILRIHQYSTTCAPTFIQLGAARGMKTQRTETEVTTMIDAFARRRTLLMAGIGQIENLSYITPYGAFYLMVNVSKTGMNGAEFAKRLLQEKYVAVVPAIGLGDGCGDFIRISYATSDENLTEATKRIKEFAELLSK